MTEQQEFLQVLKNPSRVKVAEGIKAFVENCNSLEYAEGKEPLVEHRNDKDYHLIYLRGNEGMSLDTLILLFKDQMKEYCKYAKFVQPTNDEPNIYERIIYMCVPENE